MDLILKDLEPRESHLKWFATNSSLRPDGRKLFEVPEITIVPNTISTADGSAMVKFGETVVVAGVKSEVAEISPNQDINEFFVINFHMGFGSRSDAKPGPPSAETQELTARISHILRLSDIFDFQSLIIQENALCRVLYIDIVCMVDSGNVFDASILAATVALRHATFISPELNEQTGMVTIDYNAPKTSLSISSQPCAVTFGLFNEQIIMAYPNREELLACNNCYTTLVLDLSSGNILALQKSSAAIDDALLFKKIQDHLPSITQQLKASIS